MLNLSPNYQIQKSGLDQVLIYSINMSDKPVANFRNCIFSSYSDSINSSFSSSPVFGRTDPIYTFTGNSRKISTSFTTTDILARNRFFLDSLMHAMYPAYNQKRNYVSPPIFVVKFGGLNQQFVMGFFSDMKYEVNSPQNYTSMNDSIDLFEPAFGRDVEALGYLKEATILGNTTMKIDLQFTVINRREVGVSYENGYIFGDLLGTFYPNLLNEKK